MPDDVRTLGRKMSTQIDDAKINTFIIEVEQTKIKPLITDTVYLDIIDNPNKHLLLLNGGVYEKEGKRYSFKGLKHAIVYCVQSEILIGNNVQISRFGAVEKRSDWSDRANDKALENQYNKLTDVATSYLNECKQYIDLMLGGKPALTQQTNSRVKITIIGE